MAQNLQLIKRRIKTAKNISQVARAMEMVSASKIKKAQIAVENNAPYSKKITDLASKILKNADPQKLKHPYLTKNASQKKLLIALSPDKGLCGSLNTNLFKRMAEFDDSSIKLITVGRKFEKWSMRLNSELIASFPMGTTLPSYSLVLQIIEVINQYYLTKSVSEVYILYSHFSSFFSQTPSFEILLPLPSEVNEEENLQYLFEPSFEEIIDTLLPHYLEAKLYNALIQAFTSEQAARMIAMQNAKNNALDVADYLTLVFNKSRQESITNEILDITNAQSASESSSF